ncbi:MAG: hypothetical protein N2D54_09200 [Chloroflexota bacterium]
MNYRKYFIALGGLIILITGFFLGSMAGNQNFSDGPQSITETFVQIEQDENLTQNPPGQSIEMTAISPENVWIYCSECSGLPHILWESPNEMGVDRPLVNEGEQCLMLDQQSSSAGISKVELLCGNLQGWLSAEGISFSAP